MIAVVLAATAVVVAAAGFFLASRLPTLGDRRYCVHLKHNIQQMLPDMAHDWDRNTIAKQMIGLVIAIWQPVILCQPH